MAKIIDVIIKEVGCSRKHATHLYNSYKDTKYNDLAHELLLHCNRLQILTRKEVRCLFSLLHTIERRNKQ